MTCECICGCDAPLTPNPGRQLLLCATRDAGCDWESWRGNPRHGLAKPRYEAAVTR